MAIKQAFHYAWHGSGRRWDALPLQTVGGAVGGIVIHLLGIKMPQEVLDNPGLNLVVTTAIGGVAGVSAVFVIRLCWSILFHHLRIRLNPYLAIAALGAVIMVGATASYFWDRSRGPILWDWGFPWLNNNYVPRLNRIVINRFEIVGDNRWDDPIVVSEAFIRSDITNQRIDMDVHLKAGGNTWTSTTTKVVPSKGRFLLYGKFNPDPSNYQGLPDNEFRDQFGQFSFFFNGKLVRRFYPNDVEKLVQKLHEGTVKNPD